MVTAPSEKKVPSLTSLAFWLLVGKTLSFVLTLVLPLLLVRRLSQTEFGLYKQAFLVVTTSIAILPLGFQASAYYFLPRETERRGQVVLNILLFNALMTLAGCMAFLLYPQLLQKLFNSSQLVPYAGLIGLVIVFWGVGFFLEVIVVANQETHLSAVLIILAQFSKTVLLFTAAVVFGTVQSLIYAAVFQGVVQTVILLLYLRYRFPGFWRSFDWSVLRRQLAYALPFGLAGLLYTLETDYHNYVISNHFGPERFAIYSIGCLQLPFVSLLIEAVSSVMIPRASALQLAQQPREILELLARTARKLSLVCVPMYCFLMICGREFITGLFTANYASSWPLFAVNLTLIPFAGFLTDPVIRAYAKHSQYLLKVHIGLFALIIVGLYLMVGPFGLMGAVSVVVGTNLIGRLIMMRKTALILGAGWKDLVLLRDTGMVALAALIPLLVTFGVKLLLPPMKPLLVLAMCAAVYGVVYLITLLLLKIPSADERELVTRYAGLLFRKLQPRAVESV